MQRGKIKAALAGLTLLFSGCTRVGFSSGSEDIYNLRDFSTGGEQTAPRLDASRRDGAWRDGAWSDGPPRDGAWHDATWPDGLQQDQFAPDKASADILPADGPGAALDSPSLPLLANADNDDCTNPLLLDLAQLGTGSIDVQIDTQGAAADFEIGECSPFPEVVLLIQNAPSQLWLACVAGSGSLAYRNLGDPSCSQPSKLTVVTRCGSGGSVGGATPATTYVKAFCRDPALGPATLRFYGAPP